MRQSLPLPSTTNSSSLINVIILPQAATNQLHSIQDTHPWGRLFTVCSWDQALVSLVLCFVSQLSSDPVCALLQLYLVIALLSLCHSFSRVNSQLPTSTHSMCPFSWSAVYRLAALRQTLLTCLAGRIPVGVTSSSTSPNIPQEITGLIRPFLTFLWRTFSCAWSATWLHLRCQTLMKTF